MQAREKREVVSLRDGQAVAKTQGCDMTEDSVVSSNVSMERRPKPAPKPKSRGNAAPIVFDMLPFIMKPGSRRVASSEEFGYGR